MHSSSRSRLNELPDDLLLKIFLCLDRRSVALCGSVCWRWHGLSLREDVRMNWTSMSFHLSAAKHTVSADRIEAACVTYPKVDDLGLFVRAWDVIPALRKAVEHLRHLKTLSIHCNLNEEGVMPWRLLAATMDEYWEGGRWSVEELRIRRVRDYKRIRMDGEETEGGGIGMNVEGGDGDGDEGGRTYRLWYNGGRGSWSSDAEWRGVEMVIGSPSPPNCCLLRHVEIEGLVTKFPNRLTFGNCPELRTLSLQDVDTVVSLRLRHCPNLQSVHLSSCRTLRYVAGWSHVAHLHISRKHLDPDHQLLYPRHSLSFPNLRTLFLHCCAFSFQTLDASPFLHSLTVSKCTGWGQKYWDDLRLIFPSLRSFTLTECPQLAYLSIASPDLTTLHISACPGLYKLHISSTSLSKLVAPEGVRSLSLQYLAAASGAAATAAALDIQCPGLRALNVAAVGGGPLLLHNDFLPTLTRACPQIHSLDLSRCTSLESLAHLSAFRTLPYLIHLDLSYTNISAHISEMANVRCPALRSLKLAGCERIGYGTPPSPAAATDDVRSMARMGMINRRLETLDISYGNIWDSALEWLLHQFTGLTHVNLQGCANLTADDVALRQQHRPAPQLLI